MAVHTLENDRLTITIDDHGAEAPQERDRAAMLRDERWSAFRILFFAQLLSLAAIAVSLVVRREDLLWDRPLTVPFLVLIGAAAVAYGGLTAWANRCAASGCSSRTCSSPSLARR